MKTVGNSCVTGVFAQQPKLTKALAAGLAVAMKLAEADMVLLAYDTEEVARARMLCGVEKQLYPLGAGVSVSGFSTPGMMGVKHPIRLGFA